MSSNRSDSGLDETASARQTRPHDACFQFQRVVVLVVPSLLFATLFFQRACPSVVAVDMALAYGVDKGGLSIFSSVFFYPCALMPPFGGLLADVTEPSFLIAGTVVGCANVFTFLLSAVFQSISSVIIEGYRFQDAEKAKYTVESYRQGLLIVCTASVGIGVVLCLPMKDTDFGEEEKSEKRDEKKEKEEDVEEVDSALANF